jgi:hypothetical protein
MGFVVKEELIGDKNWNSLLAQDFEPYTLLREMLSPNRNILIVLVSEEIEGISLIDNWSLVNRDFLLA